MLKYESFYRRHVRPESQAGPELRGFCPIHNDTGKASFSVNLQTGKWKCFAKCGGGTAAKFAKLLGLKLDDELKIQDAADSNTEKRALYVPASEIKAAVKRLWGPKGAKARQYLNKRGINNATIKQFELGLGEENRVWIPVKDGQGYRNVRRYDWQKIHDAKFIHYKEGYGDNQIWPYGVVQQHDTILLFEGEPDCLLAHSLGFTNAICTTGGAGSWEDSFSRVLAGKRVIICYDIDDAGRLAAQQLRHTLSVRCSPAVIDLPITEPPTGDFTDYMKSVGLDPRPFIENLLAPLVSDKKPSTRSNLLDSATAENYEKRLALRAVVNGQDLTPYMVPDEIQVQCQYQETSAACSQCPLRAEKGQVRLKVPQTHGVVLAAPGSTDGQVRGSIQGWLQIPQRCPGNRIEVLATRPLWEVSLVNDLDSDEGREDGQYASRRAFSLVPLQPNAPYEMEALATRDPKTQAALLEITGAEGSATSLETFNPAGKEKLLKIWEV